MRIVMNQYADGKKFGVETTSDGGEGIRQLLGERKVGACVSACLELACDDPEQCFNRLEESLERAIEEVRKRVGRPTMN